MVANLLRQYKKEIMIFFFAFLLSSASFALGYLANREYSTAPIVIEKKCDDI